MGNGVMAIGPQLPRPSSTLPDRLTGLSVSIFAVGGLTGSVAALRGPSRFGGLCHAGHGRRCCTRAGGRALSRRGSAGPDTAPRPRRGAGAIATSLPQTAPLSLDGAGGETGHYPALQQQDE